MVQTRRFKGGKNSTRQYKRNKHHSTHRRKVKRYSRRGTKRRRTKRVKRGGANKTRKIMRGGGMTYFLGLPKREGGREELVINSILVEPAKDSWGRANSASVENVKKALNKLSELLENSSNSLNMIIFFIPELRILQNPTMKEHFMISK